MFASLEHFVCKGWVSRWSHEEAGLAIGQARVAEWKLQGQTVALAALG